MIMIIELGVGVGVGGWYIELNNVVFGIRTYGRSQESAANVAAPPSTTR